MQAIVPPTAGKYVLHPQMLIFTCLNVLVCLHVFVCVFKGAGLDRKSR